MIFLLLKFQEVVEREKVPQQFSSVKKLLLQNDFGFEYVMTCI